MAIIETDNNLIKEAAEIVFSIGQASVSMLQRQLKLGYSEAARLIDTLEELGVVGEFAGSTPRTILMSREEFLTLIENNSIKGSDIKSRRSPKEIKAKMPNDLKIPLFLSAKQDLALSMALAVERLTQKINKSENVSSFITHYQSLLNKLEALKTLGSHRKVNLYGIAPTFEISNLEKDFQLHLCNAIVRAKESVLEDVKVKYRNARQYQVQAYKDFLIDIKESEEYFGQDAYELAQNAKEEVALAAGAELQHQQTEKQTPKSYDISIADNMEGLEFEGFCARLLAWNGFTNVEVTQASGDQGIDVLAEKDGIKYAVQCKCYTSDLGNTPVQEAHAGKVFYKCHVAVVMTNRYFTAGAKSLAAATGVLLWNRDELQRLLDEAIRIERERKNK